MRDYELLYIIKTDLSEEDTQATVERYNTLLAKEGAEVTSVDKWGKRKLAYEVKKNNEGIYLVLTFDANADLIEELQRNYRITDEVIKFIVIKIEE